MFLLTSLLCNATYQSNEVFKSVHNTDVGYLFHSVKRPLCICAQSMMLCINGLQPCGSGQRSRVHEQQSHIADVPVKCCGEQTCMMTTELNSEL